MNFSRLAFLPLLLLLCIGDVVSAKDLLDEKHALNLLVSRIRKDRLYDNWTSVACLSFATEEKTKLYFDFAILERHGGTCPGDPLTSPVVDRFKVHRSTQQIEWFDSAEDEYLPYMAVLKFRRQKSK